jgi:hypothetical protein
LETRRYEVLAHVAGGASSDSGIPSEAEYAQIRPFLLEVMPRERLYRRRMLMANDALDRRFQVMPPAVQARLGETLVGKALLLQHDHERLPVGLWYDAKVRPAQAGELGSTVLEASFYMARGSRSDGLIADLDAGVLRYGSLGFAYDKRICSVCQLDYYRCPHSPGEMTEDGEQVQLVWGGDLSRYESHEGSLVSLGCVRGAEMIRQGYREGDRMEGIEKIIARIDALEARHKPAAGDKDSLAADGQAYREHCLAELSRIGKLIGQESEAAALAQAFEGASVARILPVLQGYEKKLNEKFPVSPIGEQLTADEAERVVNYRRPVSL